MRTLRFWEPFAQDIRYALRSMAGGKLFTCMAALSLALGIADSCRAEILRQNKNCRLCATLGPSFW